MLGVFAPEAWVFAFQPSGRTVEEKDMHRKTRLALPTMGVRPVRRYLSVCDSQQETVTGFLIHRLQPPQGV